MRNPFSHTKREDYTRYTVARRGPACTPRARRPSKDNEERDRSPEARPRAGIREYSSSTPGPPGAAEADGVHLAPTDIGLAAEETGRVFLDCAVKSASGELVVLERGWARGRDRYRLFCTRVRLSWDGGVGDADLHSRARPTLSGEAVAVVPLAAPEGHDLVVVGSRNRVMAECRAGTAAFASLRPAPGSRGAVGRLANSWSEGTCAALADGTLVQAIDAGGATILRELARGDGSLLLSETGFVVNQPLSDDELAVVLGADGRVATLVAPNQETAVVVGRAAGRKVAVRAAGRATAPEAGRARKVAAAM
eukprot:tig00000681_g3106.t1